MLTHYGCRKGSEKELTRFVLAYPVRRKSVAPDWIRHGHHFIKSRFGRHIRHIQFDNAKEYLGSEMKQCMRDLNWFATYSPKYTAVQNRHAEKTNHLVCSTALCMMVRAQAPSARISPPSPGKEAESAPDQLPPQPSRMWKYAGTVGVVRKGEKNRARAGVKNRARNPR